MLRKAPPALLLVAACVMTACGDADSSDGTNGGAPAADLGDAAADDCQQLVDNTTYAKVVDASSTTGVEVSGWLQTRGASGVRVPDLEKQYAGITSITVCLMDAPGIAIPAPRTVGGSEETENQYAIVLLNAGAEPVLDSAGPATKVQALFDKLVHSGDEKAAG